MEGAPSHRIEQVKSELSAEKEILYRFVNYGSHQFIGIDKVDISALAYSKSAIENFFKVLKSIDLQHFHSFKI